MKTVKVVIEEVCANEFEISIADDMENDNDVIRDAIEKYKNCELVLEPGEVQHRQISIVKPDKTEWVQF